MPQYLWRVTILLERQNVNCKMAGGDLAWIRERVFGPPGGVLYENDWLELNCLSEEDEDVVIRVKRLAIHGIIIAPYVRRPGQPALARTVLPA